MENYSCSDNIKKIIIKNMTEVPLFFNNEIINVEETRVFEMEKGKE
jgi:hypothetical protein